jgi:hypothetical protein
MRNDESEQTKEKKRKKAEKKIRSNEDTNSYAFEAQRVSTIKQPD